MLNELSRFLKTDTEKQKLIDELLNPPKLFYSKGHYKKDIIISSFDYSVEKELCEISLTKFCPKCHKEYPYEENVCFDCLVALKSLSDKVPVSEIKTKPEFIFKGTNDYGDFESLLSQDNVNLINDFKFSLKGYDEIIRILNGLLLKTLTS